jgi:glycosyltransferase involved in cell wall biosynthesis
MLESESSGANFVAEAETVAPRLTVLIDTYNYGQFIEQAIDSVLSQDFPLDKVQILVVDDGSTDDTSDRVRKYGSQIEYLRKPNGGQASAFNFGIARSRGEIVALLDADDYWMPTKLRRIVDEFGRHPETGMIYHRLFQLNTETNETGESVFVSLAGYLPDKPSDFVQYFPHQTSCIAFKRKLLQQVIPIPENLRVQADGYLGATMVFVAPVLGLPECLGTYRIHGRNLYHDTEATMTPKRRRERIDARQGIIDGVLAWLKGRGYNLSGVQIRAFLTRWRLYQENDQFLIEPPGRLRFFRHLMGYIRCYGPHMSSRLRVINYVNAFGALVVGYKHFYWLEVSRKKAVKLIRQIFRRETTATKV